MKTNAVAALSYGVGRVCGVSLAVALFLVAGCGDEADRIAPPPRTPNYSGFFDVQGTLLLDVCKTETTIDTTLEVRISGSDFSMRNLWFGTWCADSLVANGESERMQIRIGRGGCTIETYSSVRIAFITEDSFIGSIRYRSRAIASCEGQVDCESVWTITGTRRK